MRVDIDKLEALEKAATPGPWAHIRGYVMLSFEADEEIIADFASENVIADLGAREMQDNGAFIAEGRNAFPELVREVRELRGIAEAARELEQKVLEAPWRAGWDLVKPLSDALARYDAGGPS